nr:reverse transcriptase domain-containing protein [Tanacetum cinerariifolium]
MTTSDFSNYMKANDAVMKNMQTQMTSLTNSNIELKNMFGTFMKINTPSTSGSGPLSSNTIANPKGKLKAITTRSGVSYERPPILPLFSSLPKVVKRELEVTKDTMQLSTENIQPPVVQTHVLIDKPVVKPTMPYPLRINKQKLQTSLLELTPTQMILELADLSTTRPTGIAEDIFVKVGKFHFLTDFVVVDYVVDPRVPLILERPFLRTVRALIDFYSEELTLRVDDEAITFKVGQTLSFSYNDSESINRIDVIEVACEEYAQEVLGFSESSTSGNPTSEPIISTSSPTLTPFGDSDFLLEETDAFLAIEDDSISPELMTLTMIRRETFILLLQEFDVIIRDKKEAENLAANHLSRLENPHQSNLEKKEITKTFPLETLGMVTFQGDSSSSWFADFANYRPFPSSRGNKYILVAINYLSKWVEAKALLTNDTRVVKFLKSLFPRFGTPCDIISDRGENRASWSKKLDDALWAFRTTFKTHIRIASDCEDSRANGFVLRSLELQSLA